MPGSINSHYFHIIGDKLINPMVGVYIPIIRIPIKGGMTIPNIATFDHGTHNLVQFGGRYIGQIFRIKQCKCRPLLSRQIQGVLFGLVFSSSFLWSPSRVFLSKVKTLETIDFTGFAQAS